MARPQYPDHLGRMPGHPRYGNPCDPQEEAERISGALKNLDDWAMKYGGSFSGGVNMQYGSGKKYSVQVGSPELAQKIVSRPLSPPFKPRIARTLGWLIDLIKWR